MSARRSEHVVAAGSYVACGLSPFAVERGGKKPVVAWRAFIGRRLIDERSFEELDDYVARWWGGDEPPNIGIPTGVPIYLDEERTAPLLVVDIDDEAARGRVEAVCGWPIITPTVRTPRGGWHLWFVHAGGNRARVGGVGLDVRGRGGYVVAPPSVGQAGRYEWVIAPRDLWPPTLLPAGLRDLIWPPRPSLPPRGPRRRGYAAAALEREVEAVRSAPEGTRNDTLNRAAFALSRFVRCGELSAAEVGEELLRAALAAGLPQREAEATILSGLRSR